MPATVEAQAVREVSIRELIARHPGQEGLRLMTVKAYFDGSGKSDDPNVYSVALAGYVATEKVWEDFEGEFVEFRETYGINYFHSADLEAREGAYQNLSTEGTAIARAGLMVLLRKYAQRDFSAVIYSVSMTDYRLIKRKLPTPEAICGSGALDDLCQTVPWEHELQVFYDRGERFFPRLQNMWRNEKRRAADPRLDRINVFGAVDDWRKYPAIQAADLLAWCVGRGPMFRMDLAMLTTRLKVYGKDYHRADLETLPLPLPFYGTGA
jgi:uncharacterized protein DUF3800